jgi:hypothetical protein
MAFLSKGQLAYTAEAALGEDGTLTGSYSKGASQSGSANITLVLHKDTAALPPETGSALAQVVVFRKHYQNCPQVKDSGDGRPESDWQVGSKRIGTDPSQRCRVTQT